MSKQIIFKPLIVMQIVLLAMTFLAGCMPPPATSPLPTPTTLTGTLLPVELIGAGGVCERLDSEYQLFFAASKADWDSIRPELKTKLSNNPDTSGVTEAILDTDFQAYALLLAVRTCHSSSAYLIAVDRVVEVTPTELYVYVSLLDPSFEHGMDAMEAGHYQIARIPWSADNTDNPTIKEVVYTQLRNINE